jgi:NAD(P)H-flavin reductase
VAGGVGLAPLRSAVYAVLGDRQAFGHVSIIYGARTPYDRIFIGELDTWRANGDLDVLQTVDRASPDWTDHVGVVPALLRLARFEADSAVAFICGPEVMMRFTARELERRGMSDDRIFFAMERNMKCAVGLCGRCQYGPSFICKDGPVLRFDRIRPIFSVPEV